MHRASHTQTRHSTRASQSLIRPIYFCLKVTSTHLVPIEASDPGGCSTPTPRRAIANDQCHRGLPSRFAGSVLHHRALAIPPAPLHGSTRDPGAGQQQVREMLATGARQHEAAHS